MSRVFAFKDNIGVYYVFNSAKTSLLGITFDISNPDYSRWEDIANLSTLTPDQLRLVSGLSLCIHSDIDDDEYNVRMDTYAVTTTTDYTHFLLKGYSNINSIKIDGSETLRVLLSFDNRKTWCYYNTSTSQWETSYLSNIYSAKSNSAKEINGFNNTVYAKKFTRSCTLDYAIAIVSGEYLTSVNLSLPENTLPTITEFKIVYRPNNETHKDVVKVSAKIDDIDDDDLTYELGFSNGSNTGVLSTGKITQIASKTYEFAIDPKDLYLGDNTITLKITDEANKYTTAQLTIVKVNNEPTIAYSYNKGLVSGAITDLDPDDKVTWRIIVNDINVTPWTDFAPSVLSFDYKIPRDWIKFGETNHCKIEFYDDVSDPKTISVEFDFDGEYFGLLFIDPAEPEYDSSGKMNKKRYYSDSLGGTIKALNIPNVITTKESATYEIGLINNSDSNRDSIVLHSDIYNDHYKLLFSYGKPFVGVETLKFDNVKVGDEPILFYVKLVSYDRHTEKVSGNIIAESTNIISDPEDE